MPLLFVQILLFHTLSIHFRSEGPEILHTDICELSSRRRTSLHMHHKASLFPDLSPSFSTSDSESDNLYLYLYVCFSFRRNVSRTLTWLQLNQHTIGLSYIPSAGRSEHTQKDNNPQRSSFLPEQQHRSISSCCTSTRHHTHLD